MKYPEFKSLDLANIGVETLDFWKKKNIFQKSIDNRPENNPYTFYEGPPSANGMPGIHHVMARAIKDIFCRYKTLKGYRVDRKGGWDTHGLPIELAVEKALGITKEDIGTKISVADYNKACKKEVMKYKEVWDDLTQKMGYWVDLDNPYITFENNYIESLWNILKKLYDKQLLYKGYSIQPYSPAAGTGLSSHELNQPGTYKDVRDTTVVAQFSLTAESKKFLSDQTKIDLNHSNVYFLAWTTTPWTLPSNTALAVGKNIDYLLVKTFNQYTAQEMVVVLAKNLLGKYFAEKNAELKLYDYKQGDKAIPFEILAELKGIDLKDLRYEQLLPYAQPTDGDAFKVLIGDFVTTDDGTGIVHLAPSFGADDFRVCKQNGMGSLTLVNKQGKFVEEVKDFAGEFVKEQYLSDAEKEAERIKQGREKYLSVDERISIKLKEENKAFKVEKYEHSYPHCWRTDKPILYYPLDSWFIRTTAVKDRMVELNKTINWKPEATGTGRFGNWLENLVDWNLSRSRFWGTPLPIWRTDDASEELCIGSMEELSKEIDKAVSAGLMDHNPIQSNDSDFDLHRPYVDNITLLSASGKPMKRESDLIDVWFDSGAMPYAQWHFPFENEEKFKSSFPADFIAEGVDQTRGWFFTLHAIAVMLYDGIAYKNVVSNGLVLDKNGNKMSKRLGNAVDPFETINKYGPDATRWYLISNAAPWENLKFNVDGLQEVQRKFFGTLYNTYSFFALYANIDGYVPDMENKTPYAERPELDRWVISKLQELIAEVELNYEQYEPHKAARNIQEFVDEHLSNWYVRLARRRFWSVRNGESASDLEKDKKAAYETLFECLQEVAVLMAPVAPFFGDWLYRNLNLAAIEKGKMPESVHLFNWPKADERLLDKDLNECMALAQNICSMVFSLRKKVEIRVRQPLQKILIPVLAPGFEEKVNSVKDLILAETNIKEIEFVRDTSGVLVKKIKPNFKVLGKKLGGNMKEGAAAISELKQEGIAELEKLGYIDLNIAGKSFKIELEDVEILSEDIPGWLVANIGKLTVALDVNISDALKEEGLARDFVNRVQNLRKESNFEVVDRINVTIQSNNPIGLAIKNNLEYIRAEILANSLNFSDTLEEGNLVEIENETVKIVIERA